MILNCRKDIEMLRITLKWKSLEILLNVDNYLKFEENVGQCVVQTYLS